MGQVSRLDQITPLVEILSGAGCTGQVCEAGFHVTKTSAVQSAQLLGFVEAKWLLTPTPKQGPYLGEAREKEPAILLDWSGLKFLYFSD